MYYTYNEKTKSVSVYTNFKPKTLPEDCKEITEEEYKELTKDEE